MKFIIEQIAICPKDPSKAKQLLKDMGAGKVFDNQSENTADLSFNYDLIQGKEFEVLNYIAGDNWMKEQSRVNSISHLGMHCTADELLNWRDFFDERGIKVAQEVFTKSHTNPVIAGKRKYNYVIFDTKEILGVDLKFIVRINQ